jgi:hypothetical protein
MRDSLGREAFTDRTLLMPQDIVARGRTQVLRAIALLLIPQVVIPLRAFLARAYTTGGIETARLIAWIGFLYLVYLGFRNPRLLVGLYTVIMIAMTLIAAVRSIGHTQLVQLLFPFAYSAIMAAGLGFLLFSSAARAFFIYQRGGQVPYPSIPQPPRGLTSA